jgi:hypothetical protein
MSEMTPKEKTEIETLELVKGTCNESFLDLLGVSNPNPTVNARELLRYSYRWTFNTPMFSYMRREKKGVHLDKVFFDKARVFIFYPSRYMQNISEDVEFSRSKPSTVEVSTEFIALSPYRELHISPGGLHVLITEYEENLKEETDKIGGFEDSRKFEELRAIINRMRNVNVRDKYDPNISKDLDDLIANDDELDFKSQASKAIELNKRLLDIINKFIEDIENEVIPQNEREIQKAMEELEKDKAKQGGMETKLKTISDRIKEGNKKIKGFQRKNQQDERKLELARTDALLIERQIPLNQEIEKNAEKQAAIRLHLNCVKRNLDRMKQSISEYEYSGLEFNIKKNTIEQKGSKISGHTTFFFLPNTMRPLTIFAAVIFMTKTSDRSELRDKYKSLNLFDIISFPVFVNEEF